MGLWIFENIYADYVGGRKETCLANKIHETRASEAGEGGSASGHISALEARAPGACAGGAHVLP